ncbi:MAG: exodeoxyribonuclease VII large subunit [Pirellulales bacterium]
MKKPPDQGDFDEIARGESHARPLSVTEVTLQVKELLENSFSSVWVTGEISNLSQPQSGHCYLTLKEGNASLRAVIWRTTVQRLKVAPQDGLEVICHGNLDVYVPRGSYQLVIGNLLPKGVGPLEQALRELRKKLMNEGLFDPEHKKPLPAIPQTVAFVTSPTGAAIHDFLQVLHRRAQNVRVLVVPVRVQGDGAANEIAAAIAQVNQLSTKIDVLVVGRGGGSLEDLWAFNEEPVVRAIFASRIPVISAVGHEIDVTLADLVADIRALTPSEAAERVAPDQRDLMTTLSQFQQRLLAGLRGRAATARSRLDAVAEHRSFRRPLDRVHDLQRRLDELDERSRRAVRQDVRTTQNRLNAVAAQLESLSPLGVLGRGYSLTQRLDNGQLVHDASRLSEGEQILTRFADGEAISRVEQIRPTSGTD